MKVTRPETHVPITPAFLFSRSAFGYSLESEVLNRGAEIRLHGPWQGK
jgi:hypothetical protein